MAQPKVSIIVPVYNTDKFLKRCLDSLTNQSLKDIEIIVIDDGSKEECALLCDRLSKNDERIKVIHKKNEGLGYARNTGLCQALGEFVGFVDSDDYVDEKMYETLYKKAIKFSSDIVISGLCFVGGNIFKEDAIEKKSCFEADTVFDNEKIKELILGVAGALPEDPEDSRYGASVCKNIFKKEIIDKFNLKFMSEREILSEDTLFMIDYLSNVKRAVGIPDCFYYYVRNDESLSKSYNPKRLEKTVVFLKVLDKRLEEIIKNGEYKIYLARLTQGFGRVLSSQETVYANDNEIPYHTLRKKLEEILNKLEIKEVLNNYPLHRLPPKQALFAFFMKHRLFYMMRLLVLLRNS